MAFVLRTIHIKVGAGLRGSSESGLFRAQPLGGRKDPDVFRQPQIQAY